MNETTPKDSDLPGTLGGGECSNPNCRPMAIRPVHVLPPRRYAGEGPAPSAGPGSPSALACRSILREYRRVRGGLPARPRRRKPAVAPRPMPEVDPGREEPGDRHDGEDRRAARQSRFAGVYWDAYRDCWKAKVWHDGENHSAGASRDEERAARMRDALALRLLGDRAALNFPRGDGEGGVP